MTNSDFIKNLSLRLGKPEGETKKLLNSSFKIMKIILDDDTIIHLPSFGSFRVHIRKKRKSFNPYHNAFFMLPIKRIVTYRPSSKIKNQLRNIRFIK